MFLRAGAAATVECRRGDDRRRAAQKTYTEGVQWHSTRRCGAMTILFGAGFGPIVDKGKASQDEIANLCTKNLGHLSFRICTQLQTKLRHRRLREL